MPSFSVICPAFNASSTIEEAIMSVIVQLRPDDELIIVDDGSIDGTCEIVSRLEGRHECIQFIRSSHLGPGAARNIAIQSAKNPWLCFIDSDDIWYEGKLDAVAQVIAEYSSVNFICHSEYHVHGHERCLVNYSLAYNKQINVSEQLYMRNLFSTSAVSCRRDLVLKSGMFDETLMNAQDYELWLRMSPLMRLRFIPEPHGEYRLTEGNITSTPVRQKLSNTVKIAIKYSSYAPWYLVILRFSKLLFQYLKSFLKK